MSHSRRSSRRLGAVSSALFLPAALALAAGGCSKMPSREDAARWAKRGVKTFEKIEARLRADLATFPYARPPFRCSPNDNACYQRYMNWSGQAHKDVKAFQRRTVKLLELPGVTGVRIEIRRRAPLAPGEKASTEHRYRWGGGCGTTQANKGGSTPLAKGFSHGKYRIGWGLGQLAFDAGEQKFNDGEFRPMLTAAWTFRAGLLQVKVEVGVLGKGSIPTAYRKARMAACTY